MIGIHQKISLILPTYNEKGNILSIIDAIHAELREYDHELLVVDDNSPDGTYQAVVRQQYPHVKAIIRTENRGLANSIRCGIENAEGNIFVMMDDLIPTQDPPLQAMIMADGMGTRLRPFTEDLPKPMLPVGGKSLRESVIEQLRQVGSRRVNVTTQYKPEKISDYFGDGSSCGAELNYVKGDKPSGAVVALRVFDAPTEPMMVINGDILTHVDFSAMLAYHWENRADMTVAVQQYDIKVPHDVIECIGAQVCASKERPKMHFLVNTGIYLPEPKIYEFIPDGKHFSMTDLIQGLVDSNHTVVIFPIIEYWMDIGQLADYKQAQNDVENRRLEKNSMRNNHCAAM